MRLLIVLLILKDQYWNNSNYLTTYCVYELVYSSHITIYFKIEVKIDFFQIRIWIWTTLINKEAVNIFYNISSHYICFSSIRKFVQVWINMYKRSNSIEYHLHEIITELAIHQFT